MEGKKKLGMDCVGHANIKKRRGSKPTSDMVNLDNFSGTDLHYLDPLDILTRMEEESADN